MNARLPHVIAGTDLPASPAECVEFAQFALIQKDQPVHAVRLFEQAFAESPELATDLSSGARYNAACAAATASLVDDDVSPEDRTKFRRQTFDWLTAELRAWQDLAKENAEAKTQVAETLQHWLQDPDLAGVRNAETLAQLPEAEQLEWRQFWDEVEQTMGAQSPAELNSLP